MRLLFLNSLKGLKKKKIQMVGIILMVMLSIGIYTVMNASLSRLENRYYRYVEEMSYDEIGELMHMNNQSVRNLVHRSILKIRELMHNDIFVRF